MVNPLTAEHKRQIDEALGRIKDAEDIIRRSELAGIDVRDSKAQLADTKAKLQAIKGAFFPTGR